MLYSSLIQVFLVSVLCVSATPIQLDARGKGDKSSSSSGGGGGGGTVWPSAGSSDLSQFKTLAGFTSGNCKAEYLKPGGLLVANYPKGSYAGSKKPGPGIAGFIFDVKGNKEIETASVAKLTYEVMFDEGFEFASGGKLPGFYGGDDPKTAGKCAGGNHDESCWSARLMWREKGKGEGYFYLPKANQKLPECKGKCDVKYGASMGTGNFMFTPGKWTKITETVTLNDPGSANGEIKIEADNGQPIHVKGLTLRKGEKGKIRGVMVHTFFGGSSSPKYQSPKNQKASFRHFKVEVIKTGSGGGGSSSGSSGEDSGSTGSTDAPKKGKSKGGAKNKNAPADSTV